MSATVLGTNRLLARPSDRTIALALSIVLSKPEELKIEEYIQILRRHGAKGRSDQALSSTYRYLDRSSYWRSEYERMKDACKTAEGSLADLKLENDSLKQELVKNHPVSPAKKRKKQPDEDVILVPRSPKKQKQDAPSSQTILNGVDFAVDIDWGQIGELGNILMRSLFQVQTQIKGHQAIDPAVFTHYLIRVAATLPQIVQTAIPAHDSTEVIDNQLLTTVLNTTDRSIRLLITGIRRCSQVRDSVEILGQAVYALVQMYSKLLECLDAISIIEVRKTATENSSPVKRKSASPTKGKAKAPKQTNINDNAALSLMTKLLCSVIEGLDSKVDIHKSLYEGFAYVVLKRLGESLYLLMFGHIRWPTIEDEIAAYNDTDEIEDGPEATQSSERDLRLKSAKLEAPYLIHLLTRTMNAAPAHLDAAVLTRTGKPKQPVKGSMKGALAINARERFQRTLVNCMFGEEGSDDNEFHDCLKMPTTKSSVLAMPKIKEPEVQEWFKEEVWRLLGWEILSRET